MVSIESHVTGRVYKEAKCPDQICQIKLQLK